MAPITRNLSLTDKAARILQATNCERNYDLTPIVYGAQSLSARKMVPFCPGSDATQALAPVNATGASACGIRDFARPTRGRDGRAPLIQELSYSRCDSSTGKGAGESESSA